MARRAKDEPNVDAETGEVLDGPWGAGEEPDPSAEGKSLEDMHPDDFFDGLFGSDPQMSFDLGSDFIVSRSSLKIGPIPEIPVRGQWKDGEKIRLEIEVQIEQVHFKPVTTKTGQRVGTERHHRAVVLSCDPPADDE